MFIPLLRHVTTYHADMRARGANMTFMGFKTDCGTERQRGWIVSGYAGSDSHRFITNEKDARLFQESKITY